MIEEQEVDVRESRWVQDTNSYQVEFWTKMNDPPLPARPLWHRDATRLVGAARSRRF